MIKNVKFHQLGTKHEAYIKRFEKKYKGIIEFSKLSIDKNKILILSNNIEIDEFTSISTFKQFILVLRSLGFISLGVSNYLINFSKFNLNLITNSIFSISNDKQINVYRDSRKIALLYRLNLITNDILDKNNITKTKGLLKVEDIKKEISVWENAVISDIKSIINVLGRIENE